MPNMIPIAYLNENLMDCNENWHGVIENSLFIPTYFDTQQKVRKWQKTSFYFIFMYISQLLKHSK